MAAITPTQSGVQAALRAFLLNILPGFPGGSPAVFVGTISGTTLTVTEILEGTITLNTPVLGAAPGTTILAFGSGSGGLGTYTVSPSQMIIEPATMATGVDVIAGQQNRSSEPSNPWFVVMTPIRFRRFATNVDNAADCKFTASMAGNVMTVSAVAKGTIEIGAIVFGPGVAANTAILAQTSGTAGGAGNYTISAGQTISSEIMSAGQNTLLQSAEIVVQCDFHSPDTTAGDFAQTVSTAFRDEYGVDFFANENPNYGDIVPLYADDPRQIPFINAENQFEWRHILEVKLQVNQTIEVPQEYADSVNVILQEVPLPPDAQSLLNEFTGQVLLNEQTGLPLISDAI